MYIYDLSYDSVAPVNLCILVLSGQFCCRLVKNKREEVKVKKKIIRF